MNRPYVVCHILSALDGKIDGSFFSAPEVFPALQAYGQLRETFNCQATLYGTTTMSEGYADGWLKNLPANVNQFPKEDYVAPGQWENYIVAIDPKGQLAYSSNEIEKKGRASAHVIEVLCETTDEHYLGYLRQLGISYIFAGKEYLDCALALEKLYSLFGIKRLMIAGGGLIDWTFAREHLIDELSLIIAPVADGDPDSATVFERASFLSSRSPVAFRLKAIEQLDGDAIWLRYISKE